MSLNTTIVQQAPLRTYLMITKPTESRKFEIKKHWIEEYIQNKYRNQLVSAAQFRLNVHVEPGSELRQVEPGSELRMFKNKGKCYAHVWENSLSVINFNPNIYKATQLNHKS